MQTSTGSLMRQQAKKTAYITLTDHNTLWGGEMTDYSDLVKRLRRDGVASRDTFKCVEMAPTVDPEDALKAADAIEAQEKRIADLQKVLSKADEKMERLEQYMDRVQNLIAFFHADIQVAICKDKK